MSRFIMFSQFYPAYHPRKGAPTYFVEKMLYDLITNNAPGYGTELLKQHFVNVSALEPGVKKSHTIRAGNNWKVGDKFSPHIWAERPYRSKHFVIGPDIEVKKVWTFEKGATSKFALNENELTTEKLIEVAKNDGLDISAFCGWFNKQMFGQIICWNENINY